MSLDVRDLGVLYLSNNHSWTSHIVLDLLHHGCLRDRFPVIIAVLSGTLPRFVIYKPLRMSKETCEDLDYWDRLKKPNSQHSITSTRERYCIIHVWKIRYLSPNDVEIIFYFRAQHGINLAQVLL